MFRPSAGERRANPKPTDRRFFSRDALWRFYFGPSPAVTTSGVVGITYYSVPPSVRTAPSILAEHWLVTSGDHSATFSKPELVGAPFELTRAPVPGLYFLGEYQRLPAGTSFYPFFATANPAGVVNRTDVFASPGVL